MAILVRLENGTELILDRKGQDIEYLRKWFPHLRIHDVEEDWAGVPYKASEVSQDGVGGVKVRYPVLRRARK